MTSHERRRRRSSHGSSHAPRRSAFRVLALAAAGLTLMGAAYQSAFAGPGTAPAPNYDTGGGLSTGETAAIVGGAAVGGYGLLLAAGVLRGGDLLPGQAFPIGAPHECEKRYDELPQDHTDLSEIRLIPRSSNLDAGFCRCFYLEVKSRKDGKWYSVNKRPESNIYEIDDARTPLTRMDGTKNVFCLPITASQSFNGQSTLLEGTFTLAGKAPMTAQARVVMTVPDEAGLFRNEPQGYSEGTLRPGPR